MAITIEKEVAVPTEPASSNTRPLKLMSIQETARFPLKPYDG